MKKLIELKERKESRITPLSLDLTNATATNAGLREDNDFLEKSIQEKKSIILQYKNQIEGLMKNKDEKKFSVEEKSKEVSSLEYEVQKIKEKIADLRIRVILNSNQRKRNWNRKCRLLICIEWEISHLFLFN